MMYTVKFKEGTKVVGEQTVKMHWLDLMLGLSIMKRDGQKDGFGLQRFNWDNVDIYEWNRKGTSKEIVREGMENF
jgi:hypothetical protein